MRGDGIGNENPGWISGSQSTHTKLSIRTSHGTKYVTNQRKP